MKNYETAHRLTEAMSDINIKPIDLSVRSGVSKSSISQYMNGSHAPSNVAATALSEVLGVSPVWLMGFDVPKDGNVETPEDIFSQKFRRLMPHEQEIVMQLIDTLLENAKKKESHASVS